MLSARALLLPPSCRARRGLFSDDGAVRHAALDCTVAECGIAVGVTGILRSMFSQLTADGVCSNLDHSCVLTPRGQGTGEYVYCAPAPLDLRSQPECMRNTLTGNT